MPNKFAYIRFVGGPRHNEVLCVNLQPCMEFVEAPKLSLFCKAGPVAAPSYRRHFYRLMRFYTEFKTIYSQYVHESLLRHGDPPFAAYGEVLPTMEFDPTPLLVLRGG